jgi:CheY-like chemotaxis protein
MGGTLIVASTEDEGSTFTFMIPCKIPVKEELSDDPDDAPNSRDDFNVSDIEGSFVFKPKVRPSLLSSGVPLMNNTKLCGSKIMCYDPTNISEDHKLLSNGFALLNENSEKCAPAASQSNGPSVRSIDEEQDDGLIVFELNSQAERISSSRGDTTSVSGADIQEGRKACNALEEKSINKKSKCSPSSSKAKILLVEDNKVNIMVAKSMLAPLGYGIDIVNNGVEAIRAVQQCQYDLILMV